MFVDFRTRHDRHYHAPRTVTLTHHLTCVPLVEGMASRLEAAFQALEREEREVEAYFSPNKSLPTGMMGTPEVLPGIPAGRGRSSMMHRYAKEMAVDEGPRVDTTDPLHGVQLKEHTLLVRDCAPITIVHGFFSSPFDDLADNPFSLSQNTGSLFLPPEGGGENQGNGQREAGEGEREREEGEEVEVEVEKAEELFMTPAQRRAAWDKQFQRMKERGELGSVRPGTALGGSGGGRRGRSSSRKKSRQGKRGGGRRTPGPRAATALGHVKPGWDRGRRASNGSVNGDWSVSDGGGGSGALSEQGSVFVTAPEVTPLRRKQPFLVDPLNTGFRPRYAAKTKDEVVEDKEKEQRHADFDQQFESAVQPPRDWLRAANIMLFGGKESPVPPVLSPPGAPLKPLGSAGPSGASEANESYTLSRRASLNAAAEGSSGSLEVRSDGRAPDLDGAEWSALEDSLCSFPQSSRHRWQVKTQTGVSALAESSRKRLDDELQTRSVQLHSALRRAFHGAPPRLSGSLRVEELFSSAVTASIQQEARSKFKNAAIRALKMKRGRGRRGSLAVPRASPPPLSPTSPTLPTLPTHRAKVDVESGARRESIGSSNAKASPLARSLLVSRSGSPQPESRSIANTKSGRKSGKARKRERSMSLSVSDKAMPGFLDRLSKLAEV